MVTDPIADMLARIRNAQMVHAERVSIPSSKVKFRVANILKEAGYLSDVSKKKRKGKKAEHEWLDLGLSYDETGQSAVSGIKLISKPSRRLYSGSKDLKPVRAGFGVAVISTSKGIMTSKEARKQGLGGEIMFEIW